MGMEVKMMPAAGGQHSGSDARGAVALEAPTHYPGNPFCRSCSCRRVTCGAALSALLLVGLGPCLLPLEGAPSMGELEVLSQAFQGLPEKHLNAEQREILLRDGFVVLRGVLPSELTHGLLMHRHHSWSRASDGWLAPLLSKAVVHTAFFPSLHFRLLSLHRHNARFHMLWLTDHWLRFLLRDGPLGGLASSALNVSSVRILMTEAWKRFPVQGGGHLGGTSWHSDDQSMQPCPGWRKPEPVPLMTVWVALTDAPDALQFLPGSHRAKLACPGTIFRGTCLVDPACLLSPGGWSAQSVNRSQPDVAMLSFKAGDAVIFNGLTYHRSDHLHSTAFRAALCARFVPADLPYSGSLAWQMEYYLGGYERPRLCESMEGPLFPVVHPREESTVDRQRWPVPLGDLDLFRSRLFKKSSLGDVELPRCPDRHSKVAASGHAASL